jgi:hypothetical protein
LRHLIGGVVALFLAGCAGELGQPMAASSARSVVAAPSGFCPLGSGAQNSGGSVFVAFSRCAPQSPPSLTRPDAVLTASLGATGSAQGADLSPVVLTRFFTAREGRATLSRSGDPNAVVVHDVSTMDGAVIVRLTDRSRNLPPTVGPGESWRAVLSTAGRLVTLTVQSRRDVPLTTDQGRALIRAFVRSVRSRTVV